MAAIERWNEGISDNIASSSSTGHKTRTTAFQMKAEPGAVRSTSPGQSVGAPEAYSKINFGQGEFRPTGQTLDLAISGDGFFAVELPSGQVAYTRNGQFTLSPDNRIVTSTGGELLGEGGVPIILDPAAGQATISPDGEIKQGEHIVGRIPVYELPKDEVKTLGGSLFMLPEGVAPDRAENATIQQGVLESSNVSVVGEMVSLIAASRAYEAAQKVLTTHEEMSGRAVQTFSQ